MKSYPGVLSALLLAIAAVVWAPPALAGTLLTLQYTDPKTNSNFDDHAEHENTPFVSGNKVLKAWLFHEKKGICAGDPRCTAAAPEKFPDVKFVIRKWDTKEVVAAELIATRNPTTHEYSTSWNTTSGSYPDGIYV